LVGFLQPESPPVKFQQKTANAVEGKVCPDRLSQQFVAVTKFFESAEKDTNSPLISCEKIALKPKKFLLSKAETSNPIKTASAKLHKLILTLAVYFNKIFAELQTTAD
jgi:hypothetical protein